MREILFRGKRKDNKKWIVGYYAIIGERIVIIKTQSEDYYAVDDSVKKSHGNEVIEVNPKTVCQYTGLIDKNGREIFEGDFLCSHYDEKFPEEETMSVIVWDRFGWGIKYRDVVGKLDDFDCKNGEVTGNIFDNPELIGGKEE